MVYNLAGRKPEPTALEKRYHWIEKISKIIISKADRQEELRLLIEDMRASCKIETAYEILKRIKNRGI